MLNDFLNKLPGLIEDGIYKISDEVKQTEKKHVHNLSNEQLKALYNQNDEPNLREIIERELDRRHISY